MVSIITEEYRQTISESNLLSQEGKSSAIKKVGGGLRSFKICYRISVKLLIIIANQLSRNNERSKTHSSIF